MVMADFLGISTIIQKLLIGLVSGIYKLVGYAYQIFLTLAETNIFSQSDYQFLVEKVYIVLGVLVMFIIAYNFLLFIVDPDKNKSGSEVEKLIKKVFISFILIVLCPAIFNYAFKIQNAILTKNTIGNFFSNAGSGVSISDDSIRSGGNKMAGTVFDAFFTETPDFNSTDKFNCSPYTTSCTLEEAREYVKNGYGTPGSNSYIFGGKFSVFKNFAEEVVADRIDFAWLISLIAGGYLVYVILSFCFDLAVRVIKLAFYQIIAPICIACQIIPKKEGIFTNWWKAVSKTYASVFVRVFIMNLGVYLIEILTSQRSFLYDAVGNKGESSAGIQIFAFALLILGVVTFMKQASKLIDEIFGLGDVKLGIREKLAAGGAFAAGSMVGAGVTSLARNAVHAGGNIKKAWKENTGKDRLREVSHAAAKGLGSVVAGGVSGAYRGGKAGWKAASGADMKKAASAAAKETVEKRDEREAYRATHDLGKLHGTTPIIGGVATAAGRAVDTFETAKRWAGFDNIQELQEENQSIKGLTDDVSAVIDQCKKIILDKAMAGKKWKLGINQPKDYSSLLGLAEGTLESFAFSAANIQLLEDKITEAKATNSDVDVKGLGKKLSADQLEKIYKQYMSDFSRTKPKDYSSIIGLAEGSLGRFDFSLENVKLLQEKINESKRTGQSVEVAGLSTEIQVRTPILDNAGNIQGYTDQKSMRTFSAEQLESIMGKYMSDYSKVLADVAFKGDENFNNTFIDEKTKIKLVSEDEWNVVSSLHAGAQKARVNIKANAGSETIKAANAEAIRTQAIKLIQDAVKPGGSGVVKTDLGDITLSAKDFNYDSKSGTILSMSEEGKKALEQLTTSKDVIASAHILTTEGLRDSNRTDIVVSGDGAADKISAAGGSIMNENNRRINQIREKNSANASSGNNKK